MSVSESANPEPKQAGSKANQEANGSRIEQIRRESWDRCSDAEGTAKVFNRRARIFRNRMRLITYVGLAVPVMVGVVALSFNMSVPYAGAIAVVVFIMTLLQALWSLWSELARWPDSHAKAQEAYRDNTRLRDAYKQFAANPPTRQTEAEAQFKALSEWKQRREIDDESEHITDEERRMGMRAGLLFRQFKCIKCGEIPLNMKSSQCEVCGNFNLR